MSESSSSDDPSSPVLVKTEVEAKGRGPASPEQSVDKPLELHDIHDHPKVSQRHHFIA